MIFLSPFLDVTRMSMSTVLVTPCLVVAVQPCMGWIQFKKKKKNDFIKNGGYAFLIGLDLMFSMSSWTVPVITNFKQPIYQTFN